LADPIGAVEQVGDFFGQDCFLLAGSPFLMLQAAHLVFELVLDALLGPLIRMLQGIGQPLGMLADRPHATVNMCRHMLTHSLIT